jgi:pimeloyl-ACP methyl ester carboxylesterase
VNARQVDWNTVSCAGYRLRYAVTGAGPAVVLPIKDRGNYVPFEQLAGRYTMVHVEPLGFGWSDRPADYPDTGLHEQILAVCDSEGIDEFAVWGYSQGGAMACAIAQATPRARLLVCGGFHVLRGLSDSFVSRMNREGRIPIGSRAFWNYFHGFDWYVELRRLAIPKLMYFGSLDAQRVPLQGQHVLHGLGMDVVEFPGLNHRECGLNVESPVTETVADWLARHNW